MDYEYPDRAVWPDQPVSKYYLRFVILRSSHQARSFGFSENMAHIGIYYLTQLFLLVSTYEIDTDCANITIGIRVILKTRLLCRRCLKKCMLVDTYSEPKQQTRFANTGIANQEQFE